MDNAIPYIAIPGTGAWNSNWYKDGPWTKNMLKGGFVQFKRRTGNGKLRIFEWDTDLAGAGWRSLFFMKPSYRDWIASGGSLCDHVEGFLPPLETNIVAHSHGLEVALVAAALGLKINCLVSVMSPPRLDVTMLLDGVDINVLQAARPNINWWMHLYSDPTDKWARRGMFGNGKIEIRPNFSHPWADLNGNGRGTNRFIPGVGHSGVLNDEKLFEIWDEVQSTMRAVRTDSIFAIPPTLQEP